jgi:hypothetical protein
MPHSFLVAFHLSVLDVANGAHQNTRISAAQSHNITAQMQGKTKALSALRDSNTPNRGKVPIPLDTPALNEDGTPKAPGTRKKKPGNDKTKASAVTKKTGTSAVTTSEDGKSVSMSKGHWRLKLSSITVLKRDVGERDATILTQKEDLKQTQHALTLVTEQKNDLVIQNRDLRMEVVEVQKQIKANRDKNGGKSTKHEQSTDITKEISTFVKETLFRTIKFARPGQEMTTATQRVWNGIKGRLKLEEPPKSLDFGEFYRIYYSVVQTELSLARQYVQSRSQDAAYCK